MRPLLLILSLHIFFHADILTAASFTQLPTDVLNIVCSHVPVRERVHHLRLCNKNWDEVTKNALQHTTVQLEAGQSFRFFPHDHEGHIEAFQDFSAFVSNIHPDLFAKLTFQKDVNNQLIEALRQHLTKWLSIKNPQDQNRHYTAGGIIWLTLWKTFLEIMEHKDHHAPIPHMLTRSVVTDIIWNVIWTEQYELDFPWEPVIGFRRRAIQQVKRLERPYAQLAPQELWAFSATLALTHVLRFALENEATLEKIYKEISYNLPDSHVLTQQDWADFFEQLDTIQPQSPFIKIGKQFTQS